MTKTISSFTGKYRFLSNFYQCVVRYEDMFYPSSEHAFVAAKTTDLKLRQEIQNIETPGKVKRAGRNLVLRPFWDLIKLNTMEDIVKDKFVRNPDLLNLLLATGDSLLIEGNTWGDKYWGQCPVGNGENHLGKILMKIRNSYDINSEFHD